MCRLSECDNRREEEAVKIDVLLTKTNVMRTKINGPNNSHPISLAGADLGGGCMGCAPPPPPRDDLRFSNTTGILQKKMWFIGVEVEQWTSAPPPTKNPGSTPALTVDMINEKVRRVFEYKRIQSAIKHNDLPMNTRNTYNKRDGHFERNYKA